MAHTDRFRRVRRTAGFVLGEAVLAGLLAAGLFVLTLLLLTGFDAGKLALFLHNLTSRAVAADTTRLDSFAWIVTALWAALAVLVAAVRGVDRRLAWRRT